MKCARVITERNTGQLFNISFFLSFLFPFIYLSFLDRIGNKKLALLQASLTKKLVLRIKTAFNIST